MGCAVSSTDTAHSNIEYKFSGIVHCTQWIRIVEQCIESLIPSRVYSEKKAICEAHCNTTENSAFRVQDIISQSTACIVSE